MIGIITIRFRNKTPCTLFAYENIAYVFTYVAYVFPRSIMFYWVLVHLLFGPVFRSNGNYVAVGGGFLFTPIESSFNSNNIESLWNIRQRSWSQSEIFIDKNAFFSVECSVTHGMRAKWINKHQASLFPFCFPFSKPTNLLVIVVDRYLQSLSFPTFSRWKTHPCHRTIKRS